MSKPDKPRPAARINVQNEDQMVLLALSALFTAIYIARGNAASTENAHACVRCADALIEAVVAIGKQDKP